jgi:hypothetical protein
MPSDFSLTTVRGKGYDTEDFVGETLWKDVVDRIAQCSVFRNDESAETKAIIETSRFGNPVTVLPRLGQGAHWVLQLAGPNSLSLATRQSTRANRLVAH